MSRTFKRTAGQRRYVALRHKVEDVARHLASLQSGMQFADQDGKRKRDLYIIQVVTEAVERLRSV